MSVVKGTLWVCFLILLFLLFIPVTYRPLLFLRLILHILPFLHPPPPRPIHATLNLPPLLSVPAPPTSHSLLALPSV